MPAPRRRIPSNYVAEWFGHVVWPPEEVDASEEAVRNQSNERCPFLSSATASDVLCAKQGRTGFCTASSPSSGIREDWLACPWRVFDQPFTLIQDAIWRIFQVPSGEGIHVFPISRFSEPRVRAAVAALDAGTQEPAARVFGFSSNPPTLGGEVDIPETDRSPGNKVDVSIFEILGTDDDGSPRLGQFALFEIQTADFHGSPLHAINALRRLGPPGNHSDYHAEIAAHPTALGERVEGPNKANVFKRTIYQMILKIQMAKDAGCAGFCVVLPEPVWRSWSRHLGNPTLVDDPDRPGVLLLRAPAAEGEDDVVEPEPAWILVFRIDRASKASPKRLDITMRIATDSRALVHYAFDVAPGAAIQEGALARFSETFRERLHGYWNQYDDQLPL